MAIAESRVVPVRTLHRYIQGDNVMKYNKTIKIGNTTIHFVAPPPMTKEQEEKILEEISAAAWSIIDEIMEKEDETREFSARECESIT